MNSIDKPYTLHAAEEPTQVHSREACTMADLDAIRFEVARVDVMAIVAQEHYDARSGARPTESASTSWGT